MRAINKLPGGMAAPWDHPPELRESLVRLEALWRDSQNPIHAIEAIWRCLTWRDADGKLTGPYLPPPWACHYWAKGISGILDLALLKPPPRTATEYQRRISGALGLTSKGRNAFKNVHNQMRRMVEAAMFDNERKLGASPAQLYRMLYDEAGKEPSDPDAERRRRQARLAEGRRTLHAYRRAANTKKPMH